MFKNIKLQRWAARVAWVAVAFAMASARAADAPIELLQIAVIDKSGSMQGPRFETAISEVKSMVLANPPSPTNPWVVIPFDTDDRSARMFIAGADEVLAYLDALIPEGGTSIAAGLEIVIPTMRAYPQARHVSVALYTDGDDPDQAALKVQEDALAQIFDERTEQGLGQTVICRRWGQANAQLVARFQNQPGVHVIDAGEARLVQTTLEPVVECRDVRWSVADPGLVEIELAARVAAQPAQEGVAWPQAEFVCTTAGATGEIRITVTPDDPAPKLFTVQVKLPLDPPPAEIELQFDAAAPVSTHSDQGVVLARVARQQVSVSCPTPVVVLRGVIAARLTQAGAGRWLDPLARRAALPLRLDLEVVEQAGAPRQTKFEVRTEAEEDDELQSGTTSLGIAGPGKYVLDVTLVTTLADELRPVISLAVVPGNAPAGIIFDPERLQVETKASPPPRAVTRVTAVPESLTPAVWTNLRTGAAAFRAVVSVEAGGPLGQDSTLALVAPPGVQSLQVTPSRIRRGRQQVTIDVVAVVRPAPEQTRLVFPIQPPPPTAAVEIQCPTPLELVVPGPPPAVAALTQDGAVPATFEIPWSRSSAGGVVAVQATVVGAPPDAARGLQFGVVVAGGLRLDAAPSLRLGAPATLVLIPTKLVNEESFFADRIAEGEIMLAPPPDAPQVLAARQRVILRQEAPFKRWAAIGAGLLLALVVGTLTLRFFLRRQDLPEIELRAPLPTV